jgi:hypothetical protein
MRLLLSVLLIFLTNFTYAGESVLLGVLGEPQCKEDVSLVVRPLFVKSQKKWELLNTRELATKYLPKRVHWIATMNNKNIGDLISIDGGMTTEPPWTYPRDFWHVPETKQLLPEILNTDKAYAGWCEPPKHRPLTLVSTANFTNPEQWKLSINSRKDIELLFPAFKNSFNGVALCSGSGNQKPYKFSQKDLRVVRLYIAKDGSKLIAMKLAKDVYECDSELGDLTNARWFFIKNKSINYIGTDLTFIDLADYDGDGMSEFLFWYSGYNSDGYILFSEHFQHNVKFTWNYH